MNDKRYTYILYVITTVIITTIGIQIYWNYKNYLSNKQQLINDVQVSFDKAVDDYYANLAEQTTLGFTFNDSKNAKTLFEEGGEMSNVLKSIDEQDGKFKNLDCLDVSKIDGITLLKGFKADSLRTAMNKERKAISPDSFKNKIKDLKLKNPTVKFDDIKLLTSKIVISIKNDTLDVSKVNKLLTEDFARKNISVTPFLIYFESKSDSLAEKHIRDFKSDLPKSNTFKNQIFLNSKSAFLPKKSILQLSFENETTTVLKRSLTGILISTLLILTVISCLFYLLKIIRHQKQLAEVKNDLISNITHEFKTPIATIGVALEGINNFNVIEDKEKTKKYINMSSNQLSKLNIMVEKLLETATLDSESLELNKEDIDIVSLLTSLASRYQTHNATKTIESSFKVDNLVAKVDIFHFENALNNILDNAIKYGGDIITIDLIPNKNSFNINISDNGTSLTKASKERIFEKFYRVPKGNKHDVKGFGIGLYYTKSIVEKHNGTVNLDLNNKLTTFRIELPNG